MHLLNVSCVPGTVVNTGNRKIIKTYLLVFEYLTISYLQSLSLYIASLLLKLCITFCLVQYKDLLTTVFFFSSNYLQYFRQSSLSKNI